MEDRKREIKRENRRMEQYNVVGGRKLERKRERERERRERERGSKKCRAKEMYLKGSRDNVLKVESCHR